ncbi:GNAT family N-acetyltransferase [Anaerosporobacter faecicola]|uniref:GNAT family N-acetyltransferase n=1 Tax=Anaerosporobacter faecicola TaxID=2718714 RepID=UPI001439E09F|nr:GNAT family N-acetyltransferase [Anaerosporobacter faecicola]
MNRYIAEIMELKAKEISCLPDDFLSGDQIKYIIDEDIVFRMISFGTTTVIVGGKKIIDRLKEELADMEGIELFDAPSLYQIDSVLHEEKYALSEIYDFFIPSESIEKYGENRGCEFSVERMEKEEISRIEDIENYDNALCLGEAVSLNELAYVAKDNNRIVSIAGVSTNSEKIWWIGVDTDAEYRRKGLASFLVNRTACDVIEMGKIPVYPTWYSNIASRTTAIKAGFVPGFIEIGCECIEED